MDKVDISYILKKWSKKEKELVYSLREKGYGPLKIAKLTGFPIDQIRFWIYGTRTKKRSKKGKSHNLNSRKYYGRLKYNNWYQWKSHRILGTLRLRRTGKESLPTSKELMLWLNENTKCAYCNIDLTQDNYGIDHAIPLSRGGDSSLVNLAACCKNCNLVKGSLLVWEYLSLLKLLNTFEDKGAGLKARLKRGFFKPK